MPGKSCSHLQFCEAAFRLSAMSFYSSPASVVGSVTYEVRLLSSFHFCTLSNLAKKSYFHNVNISLCFETLFSSPECILRPLRLTGRLWVLLAGCGLLLACSGKPFIPISADCEIVLYSSFTCHGCQM